MRWLGLDPGRRRTGVALGEEEAGWVLPLTVIRTTSLRELVRQVTRLAHQHEVGGIVVGLPVRAQGEEGEAARWARTLGAAVEAELGLPLVYQGERLSTFEAERRLRARGVRGGRQRRQVDAVAAAVILEDFFRRRRLERGSPADEGGGAQDQQDPEG